jgi:hypothetical protein
MSQATDKDTPSAGRCGSCSGTMHELGTVAAITLACNCVEHATTITLDRLKERGGSCNEFVDDIALGMAGLGRGH